MYNDQEKGILFSTLTGLSILLMNLHFHSIDLFGYFGVIIYGVALIGFLVSLLFFYLANKQFKKIIPAETDSLEIESNSKHRIAGWICMAVFFVVNALANSPGLSEWHRMSKY